MNTIRGMHDYHAFVFMNNISCYMVMVYILLLQKTSILLCCEHKVGKIEVIRSNVSDFVIVILHLMAERVKIWRLRWKICIGKLSRCMI